jgi:hypothetical protein
VAPDQRRSRDGSTSKVRDPARSGRRTARGHRVLGGVLIGHTGAYDTLSRLLLGRFYGRIAADVAAVAPTGAWVLEVGCGPGHLSLRLAGDHGLEVTGLDLDPSMTQRARANADRHGGRRPAPTVVPGRRRGRAGIPRPIVRPGRQHPVDAPLDRPNGRPGRDRPRPAPRRPGTHLGLPARRAATSVRTTPRPPARPGRTRAELSALGGEPNAVALALAVHPHPADRADPRRRVTLLNPPSARFDKYWHSRPLVFSLLPRCQATRRRYMVEDRDLSLDPPIRGCGWWFLDAAQGVGGGRSRWVTRSPMSGG